MNMDMQELIGEMSALIVKIKSGAATQGEIEAFAAAAAQVHERAIVLRYKSYEAKVFGTPAMPVRELAPAEPEAPAETPEPGIPETGTPVAEEVSFDLFEEPESDSESFDLFSLDAGDDEEETLEDLTAGQVDEQEEPVVLELPVTQEPETIPEFEPFAEAEPLAAGTPVQETIGESAPIQEPDLSALSAEQTELEKEIAPDLSANQAGPEAPAMETPAPAPAAVPLSGDIHPVYKRLVIDDNSLAARLMAVRLETLKGAFGFNERLQIIRELFDGSGDVFSEAIEMLDNLPTREEARNVVSNFARRFAWDKDSDLALEFVQKVERRYA